MRRRRSRFPRSLPAFPSFLGFWSLALALLSGVQSPLFAQEVEWGTDHGDTQVYLELAWDGVTSGTVTLPPWGVGTVEEPRIVLATEDRQVRLVDVMGTEVGRTRIGMRRPLGLLHDGRDRFLVIPAVQTRVPIVRLHWTGTELRPVGDLVSSAALLPNDARGVFLDGGGMVYAVGGRGEVSQASTVGGILWERRLPTHATAMVAADGAVYVATQDRRLFRFDGAGRGEEILRTDAVIVAMTGAFTGDGRLILLDETGALLHVDAVRSASGQFTYRPGWSIAVLEPDETVPFAPQFVAGRADGEMMLVAPSRDGGITALDRAGRILWRVRFPGNPITTVVDGVGTNLLFLLDTEGRVVAVDRNGTIRTVIQLEGTPTHVNWVMPAYQLLVTYQDWRIEAFRVAAADGVQVSSRAGFPLRAAIPPPDASVIGGALRARADAVLAGTSPVERLALLETLRSQRSRAVLFGRVGEAREILGELMLEPFQAPTMGAGRVRNDFPDVRRAAAVELALYMDRASQSLLREAVRLDPFYPTVAAAMEGFARYGVDDLSVLELANARFQTASPADRAILAPAMVALLERSAVSALDPRIAAETVALLVQSNVSRELRARAVRVRR